MSRNYKWFRSTALNYDPKLHMRHELESSGSLRALHLAAQSSPEASSSASRPCAPGQDAAEVCELHRSLGSERHGPAPRKSPSVRRKRLATSERNLACGVGGCKSHRPERINVWRQFGAGRSWQTFELQEFCSGRRLIAIAEPRGCSRDRGTLGEDRFSDLMRSGWHSSNSIAPSQCCIPFSFPKL